MVKTKKKNKVINPPNPLSGHFHYRQNHYDYITRHCIRVNVIIPLSELSDRPIMICMPSLTRKKRKKYT